MPLGQPPQATLPNEFIHTSYPLPITKPNICNLPLGGMNDPYINQKQAMAAALGLYLGVKKANPPAPNKNRKCEQSHRLALIKV